MRARCARDTRAMRSRRTIVTDISTLGKDPLMTSGTKSRGSQRVMRVATAFTGAVAAVIAFRRSIMIKFATVAMCVAALMATGPVAAHASTNAAPLVKAQSASKASGMYAVKVTDGRRDASPQVSFPYPWTYQFTIELVNRSDPTWAITVESNNHLYMEPTAGASDQEWQAYNNGGGNGWIFVSDADSKCINVPGVGTNSGTQLIVYPCGAVKNEIFTAAPESSPEFFALSYDSNLSIGIGNDFPGDGAWVITYTTNTSNWEEQWTMW
jgi:hypothetical protein